MSELPEKIPLFILESNEFPALFITHYTKWVADFPSFPSFEWDFFIIDSPKGEDLILVNDFLYHFNPIIYWKNGLITYDSSGIKILLVIPWSLLSTVLLWDEDFKEIKDVGEDVSISSFHLFQGDMDLPPLSLHASLEEQWDEGEEPEEIETVLKVVPPAYHQYFDVSSKRKAEKLPLHHAYSPFIFNEEAPSQLQILKEAFTTAPIISHFNPSLPTIVETDASDYSLGAVLSQVIDSGKHLISFDSCKLLPTELTYEIHDKELLGIVWALRRWRDFLLSLSNPFEVLTDHSSLQYFMSSKVLTCRQALWAEFFSEFHFTITYSPGRLATLPDALSHWDDVYPERGVDFISKNTQSSHQVIKKDGIQESIFFSIKVEIFSYLVDKIQKEVLQDKDYK
ncbi:hypothetical protein O181_076517 [Austropuccinia psidii MF-1]|uniref:Reverse transcriptase RNase H-like domain-containing protein n=1 Tax=Austropuccinia psidii MF-1 TaxID=1389203 RepID=A0A9Q3IDV4_9BASI|nr:hypothetical protein [Austropuccinia psidii MF-1]